MVHSDFFRTCVGAVLGFYGPCVIRRDIKRGDAQSRDFSIDKTALPKPYRALTIFNGFAVALLVIGAAIEGALLSWRSISH
jgi:hypothetical protein